MNKSFKLEVPYAGMYIDVIVHSYYKGCPAKLYGPMEDCYPAEPAEVEFTVQNNDFKDLEDDEDFIGRVIDTINGDY